MEKPVILRRWQLLEEGGGGNTATECVRRAVRQGAVSITGRYSRDAAAALLPHTQHTSQLAA